MPLSPVHSMTGYAHLVRELPAGRLTIELRSVNSRFTDLHFRLSDELRAIEPPLRDALTRAVSRGKLECRAGLQAREQAAAVPPVDETALAALLDLQQRLRRLAPDAAPLSVSELIRLASGDNGKRHDADSDGQTSGADTPGGDTSGEQIAPGQALWRQVQPVFDELLAAFVASRAREGARLAAVIRDQITAMQALIDQIAPVIPDLLAQAQARLTERLQAAMADVASPVPADETFARIRQEVALLGLRGDITEELDRLRSHFVAVTETLDGGGPVGKRLDFLTQELNRESNTIASKANGLAVTDAAVALKLLIEQMREQAANLE